MDTEKELKVKAFWEEIKDSDIVSGAVEYLGWDQLWTEAKKGIEEMYDAAIKNKP